MKKILLFFMVVIFVLSMSVLSASAFENETIKLDIPEAFSSYTENSIDGTAVKQWTAPEDGSNVSVTFVKNEGLSYADLSDREISVLHTTIIAQMNNDVSETLKEYSVDFKITDSTCSNVEINGVKGVEILFDSEYLYGDGSVLEAKNYTYMFSSEENIVTISATVNDMDKIALIDDMMDSFAFKEEVYIGSNDFNMDWYSVIKSGAIGGCVAGIAALIGSMIKKKKKQKETVQTYVPVTNSNTDVKNTEDDTLKGE